MIDNFREFTKTMLKYILVTYEIIDAGVMDEINICMVKGLSLVIGANLAHCFLNYSQKHNEKLLIIDELLKTGI